MRLLGVQNVNELGKQHVRTPASQFGVLIYT